MNNRSKKKIWTGFITAIVLILLVGGLGKGALAKTSKDQKAFIKKEVHNTITAQEISELQQQVISNDRGYLLMKNISFLKINEI